MCMQPYMDIRFVVSKIFSLICSGKGRIRTHTEDSSNLSYNLSPRPGVKGGIDSAKSPLNMTSLTSTLERFDRLVAGEESTGHKQRVEREAQERKIEATRARRRRDKQILNNLEADAANGEQDTARGKGKGGVLLKTATPIATATLSSERGRSRYGPYKARDVHVFIDFIEKLDASVSRVGHERNEMSDAKSYLIGDVLSQQELLNRPKFNREITRIAAKNNSVVTLVDLLSVLFPFASLAEWHRMKTLFLAKKLILDCLNNFIEPPDAVPDPPLRSPNKASILGTVGSTR